MCLRNGIRATHALPDAKIECALQLAKLAWFRKSFSIALEGYQEAMELLPQVLWLGVDMPDRMAIAMRLKLTTVAADAAACSLEANDPEKAVELLEQGRSLMWSQSLSLQTDVSALHHSEHPELAERFMTLSSGLSSWNAQPQEHTSSSSGSTGDSAKLHQLTVEWNSLIAEIRALHGFHSFLRPKAFSHLCRAACNGPLIIFNASQYRCDAIIITPGKKAIIVPLLTINVEEVDKKAHGMSQAMHAVGRNNNDERHQVVRKHITVSTTGWLWNHVISPVCTSLRNADIRSLRVWLCPTGPFTFLPIHAARPDAAEQPGLIDLFSPSYTSTISALLRAQDSHSQDSIFRMLAVGQSDYTTAGMPPLPHTDAELQVIQQYVPVESLLTLKGSEATVDRVINELPEMSWVHFCCHGHQDVGNQPLKSSLHLHDGPLKFWI
jgi:CHAT domain-containing protein